MNQPAIRSTKPSAPSEDIVRRARGIQALVLDVDGVLTDGRLWYGPKGEVFKSFNVKDGQGLADLQRAGFQLLIITGRKDPAVAARATDLGITTLYQGVADKRSQLEEHLAKTRMDASAVCAIGDDVGDVPLFEMLETTGLSVAVADATPKARAAAHWTTRCKGGKGAVRELCELLLQARSLSP